VVGDEAAEWLGFVWPWLVILAIGSYCAFQTYLNFRTHKWMLAGAGALCALVLWGYDLATIGILLRPGSY
jgi:hypothetical protein